MRLQKEVDFWKKNPQTTGNSQFALFKKTLINDLSSLLPAVGRRAPLHVLYQIKVLCQDSFSLITEDDLKDPKNEGLKQLCEVFQETDQAEMVKKAKKITQSSLQMFAALKAVDTVNPEQVDSTINALVTNKELRKKIKNLPKSDIENTLFEENPFLSEKNTSFYFKKVGDDFIRKRVGLKRKIRNLLITETSLAKYSVKKALQVLEQKPTLLSAHEITYLKKHKGSLEIPDLSYLTRHLRENELKIVRENPSLAGLLKEAKLLYVPVYARIAIEAFQGHDEYGYGELVLSKTTGILLSHFAALGGQTSLLKKIKDLKQDSNGFGIFHYAARSGQVKCIQDMLKNGNYSLEQEQEKKWECLESAARYNQPGVLKEFLKGNEEMRSHLLKLALDSKSYEAVKVLATSGKILERALKSKGTVDEALAHTLGGMLSEEYQYPLLSYVSGDENLLKDLLRSSNEPISHWIEKAGKESDLVFLRNLNKVLGITLPEKYSKLKNSVEEVLVPASFQNKSLEESLQICLENGLDFKKKDIWQKLLDVAIASKNTNLVCFLFVKSELTLSKETRKKIIELAVDTKNKELFWSLLATSKVHFSRHEMKAIKGDENLNVIFDELKRHSLSRLEILNKAVENDFLSCAKALEMIVPLRFTEKKELFRKALSKDGDEWARWLSVERLYGSLLVDIPNFEKLILKEWIRNIPNGSSLQYSLLSSVKDEGKRQEIARVLNISQLDQEGNSVFAWASDRGDYAFFDALKQFIPERSLEGHSQLSKIGLLKGVAIAGDLAKVKAFEKEALLNYEERKNLLTRALQNKQYEVAKWLVLERFYDLSSVLDNLDNETQQELLLQDWIANIPSYSHVRYKLCFLLGVVPEVELTLLDKEGFTILDWAEKERNFSFLRNLNDRFSVPLPPECLPLQQAVVEAAKKANGEACLEYCQLQQIDVSNLDRKKDVLFAAIQSENIDLIHYLTLMEKEKWGFETQVLLDEAILQNKLDVVLYLMHRQKATLSENNKNEIRLKNVDWQEMLSKDISTIIMERAAELPVKECKKYLDKMKVPFDSDHKNLARFFEVAIRKNKPLIVQAIVKGTEGLSKVEWEKKQIFSLAIKAGSQEVIMLLITKEKWDIPKKLRDNLLVVKALEEKVSLEERRAFFSKISKEPANKCMQAFSDRSLSLDSADDKGENILHWAIYNGNVELTRTLLTEHKDLFQHINQKNLLNQPVQQGLENERKQIFSFLVKEKGFSVHLINTEKLSVDLRKFIYDLKDSWPDQVPRLYLADFQLTVPEEVKPVLEPPQGWSWTQLEAIAEKPENRVYRAGLIDFFKRIKERRALGAEDPIFYEKIEKYVGHLLHHADTHKENKEIIYATFADFKGRCGGVIREVEDLYYRLCIDHSISNVDSVLKSLCYNKRETFVQEYIVSAGFSDVHAADNFRRKIAKPSGTLPPQVKDIHSIQVEDKAEDFLCQLKINCPVLQAEEVLSIIKAQPPLFPKYFPRLAIPKQTPTKILELLFSDGKGKEVFIERLRSWDKNLSNAEKYREWIEKNPDLAGKTKSEIQAIFKKAETDVNENDFSDPSWGKEPLLTFVLEAQEAIYLNTLFNELYDRSPEL